MSMRLPRRPRDVSRSCLAAALLARLIGYAPRPMSAGVGADIEALCSKCGDVWHVLVAKDANGRIAKVQCKQCGGQHRYKSPHGAPAVAKLPSATRPPKAPKPSRDPVERFEKPAVAADL